MRQFNSLGDVTNILRQKWDKALPDWVNDMNRTISYNSFFQVETNLLQRWGESSWIDSLRASYSYTAEGNISHYLEELSNGVDWENLYQEQYSYDSKEITIDINNWDTDAAAWENDVLITNYLNAQGYILIEQYDFWNSILKIYETGYYDEYEEDGTNPEYFEKYWNDSLNKFTGGLRILSSYLNNLNRNIKQRIYQEWDTVSSEWENNQKIDYFWSAMVAVDELGLNDASKIYPSPFSNFIHIDTGQESESNFTLRIFDLQGSLVDESEFSGRKATIDLSHLKNGLYLAELHSKQGISVLKIIKN
jgi:hypothetical protein